MGLLMESRYGGFEDGGRVYAITDWRTPRPWINVLSNGRWGCTVSQTGSGYAWHGHAMYNRMTRWNQDLLLDRDGIFWYLRDDDTGEVWSVTPRPALERPDRFVCRHGLGFTSWSTAHAEVGAELTVSVPPDLDGQVYHLKLTNESDRPRRISAFVYLEPHAGEAPGWHREFHQTFLQTFLHEPTGALVATSRLWTAPMPGTEGWNKDWPWALILAGSPRPTSVEGSRGAFLGPYGDPARPAGLTQPKLTGTLGTAQDPCMALGFRLSIPPGGEESVSAVLGAADREGLDAGAGGLVAALADAATAAKRTRSHWEELCSRTSVTTPEPALDAMVNWWLPYQAMACRLLGRSAYYQCGGAFGYRDQLQDSLVWLATEPGRTRSQLLLHARHQFVSGRVRHWWHPLSEDGPDTGCSDDLLWLPFAVLEYLNETGDDAVLDEQAPFVDGPPVGLFEHCRRAVDHALGCRSSRGLPLMGTCDWNDGMNAVGAQGRGESVWLGFFLLAQLPRLADLAAARGLPDVAERWRDEAGRLRDALLTHGWEGDRFVRAFTDDGAVLGSASCARGSLFLNPQTWAVIAGVAEGDGARKLMDLVETELGRPYGSLLFAPAYDRPDASIGYLTRYAPGVRENGGVYTHAAVWAIIAAAVAYPGDQAFRLLHRLLPPVRSGADPDLYAGEPYVTPGNIEGPGSCHEGRGGWTWYTGSAAWMRRAALDRVLGVRVEGGKLVVDPRVPEDWESFTVRRRFRGETVVVEAKRVDGTWTASLSQGSC